MPVSGKLPAISNLSDFALYAFLSMGILAILIFLSLSFAPSDPPRILFQEEPLQKQPMALQAGEFYRYRVESNLSDPPLNFTVTYLIGQHENCTNIYISESQNKTPTCLNPQGNDQSGINLSLENPLIYFFRPWMLAVNENWEWQAVSYLSFSSADSSLSEIELRTTGMETVAGRPAYKVTATLHTEEETEYITYWVDQQKHILLREEGRGYAIGLVSSSIGNNH